jgi:hypothetical protein
MRNVPCKDKTVPLLDVINCNNETVFATKLLNSLQNKIPTLNSPTADDSSSSMHFPRDRANVLQKSANSAYSPTFSNSDLKT